MSDELHEAIGRVMDLAYCCICPSEGSEPVTELRVCRVPDEPGKGRITVHWYCHGEEYGGRQGEMDATVVFFAALAEFADAERERCAKLMCHGCTEGLPRISVQFLRDRVEVERGDPPVYVWAHQTASDQHRDCEAGAIWGDAAPPKPDVLPVVMAERERIVALIRKRAADYRTSRSTGIPALTCGKLADAIERGDT